MVWTSRSRTRPRNRSRTAADQSPLAGVPERGSGSRSAAAVGSSRPGAPATLPPGQSDPPDDSAMATRRTHHHQHESPVDAATGGRPHPGHPEQELDQATEHRSAGRPRPAPRSACRRTWPWPVGQRPPSGLVALDVDRDWSGRIQPITVAPRAAGAAPWGRTGTAARTAAGSDAVEAHRQVEALAAHPQIQIEQRLHGRGVGHQGRHRDQHDDRDHPKIVHGLVSTSATSALMAWANSSSMPVMPDPDQDDQPDAIATSPP